MTANAIFTDPQLLESLFFYKNLASKFRPRVFDTKTLLVEKLFASARCQKDRTSCKINVQCFRSHILLVTRTSFLGGPPELGHEIDLNQVLCLEHVRKIAKDQSISWHGTKFEIISKHSFNLRSYEAVVRVYLNGSTKIFVMGHEVCVRTSIREPYSDPYAVEIESNVSLVYLNAKREQETYIERKDEWIKKVYGSYETYERYCKKKPA